MNKIKFSTISILVILIGVLILPSNRAATLNSNWATTSPTIDGTIASGEWDDAASTTFYTFGEGINKIVFFWAKNNASFLFLRIQWQDMTQDFDFLLIYFDETNSGTWPAELNNAVEIYAGNDHWLDSYIHWDGYWTYSGDIGSQDGGANTTYNAGTDVYTTEIAVPLGRSDVDDMPATAGSLIGVHFEIINNLNDYYNYPNGSASVTFQLATAPSGIGISILPIFLLALVFIIALDIVRKRNSSLLK